MGFLDKSGLAYLWGKIKAALSKKQDTLTGTEGQVVGFNALGKAVAQEAPAGGMTQADADSRYLQLSGGKMEGPLKIAKNKSITFFGENDPWESQDKPLTIKATSEYFTRHGPEIKSSAVGISLPGIVLGGLFYGNQSRLSYIGDPIMEDDAATKGYVDAAIAAALKELKG